MFVRKNCIVCQIFTASISVSSVTVKKKAEIVAANCFETIRTTKKPAIASHFVDDDNGKSIQLMFVEKAGWGLEGELRTGG